MNTDDIQLRGSEAETFGLYCTTCHDPEVGEADFAIQEWPDGASLTQVIAAAAAHASNPAHHELQTG